MSEYVLVVDDDEVVLKSVERVLAFNNYSVLKAHNGEEALALLGEEEIAVLVSDQVMPGMTGIELLARVKERSPDTLKVLMTGRADLRIAVDAINKAEVFRFIAKPWENAELLETVSEGLNRYRMIQSLNKGDESTMLSLAQTIELKDGYTRGHCDRVARYALMIADRLDLLPGFKRQIKHGSWLHDCGKIGVPESVLNHAGPLGESDMALIRNHPKWGADVARQARLPSAVINIILSHHEMFNGMGYPSGLAGAQIPLEARIVAVADVYDALVTDRPYRKGFGRQKAMEIIVSMMGHQLDPEMVEVFCSVIKTWGEETRAI